MYAFPFNEWLKKPSQFHRPESLWKRDLFSKKRKHSARLEMKLADADIKCWQLRSIQLLLGWALVCALASLKLWSPLRDRIKNCLCISLTSLAPKSRHSLKPSRAKSMKTQNALVMSFSFLSTPLWRSKIVWDLWASLFIWFLLIFSHVRIPQPPEDLQAFMSSHHQTLALFLHFFLHNIDRFSRVE
jgi:hypothetical protein